MWNQHRRLNEVKPMPELKKEEYGNRKMQSMRKVNQKVEQHNESISGRL